MKNITLSFQLHHPFHFQTFRFLDIGCSKTYYDDQRIEREINEAAVNYYLPTNKFLLNLINKNKGKLKLAFYISGTTLDQFMTYESEVLKSFRQLADTGYVEFLGGTSAHSLITLTNQKTKLAHQLKEYQTKIEFYFDKKPRVFVNSDLLYSDLIGKDIAESGYRAILTNGMRKTLTWRSPNYVYSNCLKPGMNVYFRNEPVSNELAYQINRQSSNGKTISNNSLKSILCGQYEEEPLLNIYLDYKILGGVRIEQKQLFFKTLTAFIINNESMNFVYPSEISELVGAVAHINCCEPICWVDQFHSNYYPGNDLQTEAIKQLYSLQKMVSKIDDINLLTDWNYLQTTDHIHLMDDQHPHYRIVENTYFQYKTKYDAFINYMNILDDFKLRVVSESKKTVMKDVIQENNKIMNHKKPPDTTKITHF